MTPTELHEAAAIARRWIERGLITIRPTLHGVEKHKAAMAQRSAITGVRSIDEKRQAQRECMARLREGRKQTKPACTIQAA